MNIGDLIEYRITLSPNASGSRPVQLHCRGKVVRRQINGSGATNIAATLERYEFVRSNAT